ncbi:DUF1810 family protein [Pedobacter anseongensis]|uniref:DUF1810 family protein n=1 Tax=Pedobacter anseongensis TaxID=3133439 RepID=UPI003D72879A
MPLQRTSTDSYPRSSTLIRPFIFPQLQGLGSSEMAVRYGIANLQEAQSYYDHPILGQRLIKISSAILKANTANPTKLMGSPDDLKLHSCMTLFNELDLAHSIFQNAQDKFSREKKTRRP